MVADLKAKTDPDATRPCFTNALLFFFWLSSGYFQPILHSFSPLFFTLISFFASSDFWLVFFSLCLLIRSVRGWITRVSNFAVLKERERGSCFETLKLFYTEILFRVLFYLLPFFFFYSFILQHARS